jgi:diguanylate cyclase (GGDEF)-like protein
MATAGWLRARARLRFARLELRLARERQTGFAEAVRRLGVAATHSAAAVCAELERGLRACAPAIDSVLFFDEDAGDLACVWAAGERTAYFLGTRVCARDRLALPVLARECGHRVALGEGPARPFHPADRFGVAIPLPNMTGPAGVVYVSSARAVDASALEDVVALTDHAAFAYGLARERECDRVRAEYDALTGLLAPRALRERLSAAIAAAGFAPATRIALLFVDTDRFKEWNDTYGHADGDVLLRALAGTLRAAIGPGEVAARNGGDEFCLVFADTEKSQAIERAETLRRAIATLDVRPTRAPGRDAGVRITASIGVAAFPADAVSAGELLERADEAMYHSKRTGRNGVSYFGLDRTAVRASPAAEALS